MPSFLLASADRKPSRPRLLRWMNDAPRSGQSDLVRKNKDVPPSGIRKRKGGRVSSLSSVDRRSCFRAPENVWSYKSASGRWSAAI